MKNLAVFLATSALLGALIGAMPQSAYPSTMYFLVRVDASGEMTSVLGNFSTLENCLAERGRYSDRNLECRIIGGSTSNSGAAIDDDGQPMIYYLVARPVGQFGTYYIMQQGRTFGAAHCARLKSVIDSHDTASRFWFFCFTKDQLNELTNAGAVITYVK